MKLLAQILFIARIEARFFTRFPKLLLATLAVVLIPALYALIYLSSVWDPAANTGALNVALVNLDEGVEYQGHVFNVGWEVVSKLKMAGKFGFRGYGDAEEARHLVREGRLAFALIIPKDFSSNAIPGAEPGGGRLVVYTSEGNNFESAALARHFAEELGHQVNESLNERRWALVLLSASGSQQSVERLRQGVTELRAGAKELSAGANLTANGAKTISTAAGRLNDGVGQLTSGFKQLSAGLRTMDSKRARNSDLERLRVGAETLANGHVELGRGLAELQGGSQRLREGVVAYRDDAKGSLLVSSRVTDGLDQLANGLTQLDGGLQTASGAQQRLSEGAARLSEGVGTLTTGMRALGSGIRTAVNKLPDDGQLDALSNGAAELAEGTHSLADGNLKVKNGSQRLALGLDLLADSLPDSIPSLGGSARGLANSVQPHIEVDAAVQNNGSGFAPNVIPAALWLGAGIAAFLIHVRVQPRQARFFSILSQLLGKLLIPGSVVLLQATLVLLVVLCVLKVHVVHPEAFAATLVVASLTFLLIVFALTRAFGDAGKALAMIFLAVQLSSSGGILPVELSGGLFMNISPWLPLTWVVRGLKASMFGAFDGAWQDPLLHVAAAGLVAFLVACMLGTWRFVRPSAIRPAVDF